MNDATYFLLVRIINRFLWRGALLGAENLPARGSAAHVPAVIVANHLGPQGPIGAICSIPLRLYPWIIADMVDRRLAPDYLRMDFVEPSLRLKPPLSIAFAKALSLITVPMLTTLGCVPVNRSDYEDLQDTLQESVSLLKEGKVLLIFPEAPELGSDPQTNMQPFLKGFTRLGELFYQETGEILRFYPVAVHESKRVRVGEPIDYTPGNSHGLERHRLKDLLEDAIKDMYLEMD